MADSDGNAFDSIIPAKRRKTDPQTDLCDDLLKLEQELCQNLCSLKFYSPVTHVYNPLTYAKETHEDYVRKYCKFGQTVLFLGMNPGPFGMAQNGVSLQRQLLYLHEPALVSGRFATKLLVPIVSLAEEFYYLSCLCVTRCAYEESIEHKLD